MVKEEKWKAWKEDLYASLFDRIPEALPEHSWTQDGRGWRIPTKMDGTPPKHPRNDKTKILKAQPGRIFEEGGDGKSLVDYVMERDSLSFIDAGKKLSAIAGIPFPSLDVKDQEAYRTAQQRTGLLEEATSYMAWSLQHASGKRADAVREYLQGRRWTMAEVEAVGLGYLPGWEKLKAYLVGKGHTEQEVEEALTIGKDGRLGDSHTLAIPYRSGSRILGYAFRTVTGAEPKYINSTGLDRKAGLFNLSPQKGEKDLVVVEGYLDALHATAKGLENVVAVGSSHLGLEHVQDAVAKGARTVTLCLDADEAGRKGTDKALEVLKNFPRLKAYVAQLPEGQGGKMDPDQLIQEQGIDALRNVIAGAVHAWEYELGQLLEPLAKRELLPKEVDQLLERAVMIANDLVDPLDRDRFTSAFLYQVEGLGVTKESLQGAQEQLRYERDREHQRKALESALRSASKDLDGGDPGAAVARLEGSLQQIRRERGSTLLQPATYSGWLDHMEKSLPALRTGYAALDAVARIPQAAITLVAGRPRHGKTTLMMNLLMSMAELYPGKRFLFFTYEEPSAHILTKLLNRTLGADLTAHYQYEEASTNYSYLGAYLRRGSTDVPKVETAKEKLRDLMESGRIQVIDGNYTVEDLRAILEALPAEEVGAVFLDYIQRMSTTKQTQDKRTEIAHISDQLLQIAKGTGLPLILGAQFSRAGAGKPPTLENLKEAGNLEEDANLVLSVYNSSAEKEAADGGTWGREVTLELRALKNRDGAPNGKAELTLDSWTGKISDGSKW